MTFDMVEAAKRVAAVVATATVSRVGEEHILVLVVANPLATALGPHEPATFAAQSAASHVRLRFFRLVGVGLSDGWSFHCLNCLHALRRGMRGRPFHGSRRNSSAFCLIKRFAVAAAF